MINYGSWNNVKPETAGAQMAQWFNNPLSYKGGLPVAGNFPTSVKTATGYRSIPVPSDATTASSGYIVFAPKRGYNTLDICAKSSDVAASTYTAPLLNAATGSVNNSDMDPVAGYELPIPDISQPLTVQPALEDTFAVGRVASAVMSVESATTSTTSAAMSGVLHAAKLNDLRDVATSLDPTSLSQNAITNKDFAIGVPAQRGVLTNLGPGFQWNLTPSDEYEADQKGFGTGWIDTGINISAQQFAFVGRGFKTDVADVSRTYSDDTAPYWLPRSIRITGFSNAGDVRRVCVTAVFGSANVMNGAAMTFYTENRTFWFTSDSLSLAQTFEATFKPRKGYGYIGMSVSNQDANTAVTSISFKVENLYEERNLGPVIVVAWDDVAAGQNIVVKVAVAFEGLPTGKIAPYVKAGLGAVQVDSNAVTAYASLTYDANSDAVRGVYILDQFGVGASLDATKAASDAAKAGGTMSELGASIGGILGGPVGTLLGGLGGSLFDNRGHAAGMMTTHKRSRDYGDEDDARARAMGYATASGMLF